MESVLERAFRKLSGHDIHVISLTSFPQAQTKLTADSCDCCSNLKHLKHSEEKQKYLNRFTRLYVETSAWAFCQA